LAASISVEAVTPPFGKGLLAVLLSKIYLYLNRAERLVNLFDDREVMGDSEPAFTAEAAEEQRPG
jgi:hypothetical protein